MTVTGDVSSPSSPSQNEHLTRKDYVDTADSTLTTNLAATGQNLQTQIISNDGDISNLQTQITSNDGDISTLTTNLATTGSNLHRDVHAVSGDLVTTTANLVTTGQNLQTQITSNDGDISTLTTNLTATGQNLQTQITSNDGDISTLTTNLTATGADLRSDIKNLSGEALLLTGAQTILGDKTFSNNITVLGGLAVSGDFTLGDSTTDKITTKGDLFVEDDAFFADAVHITGDLTVDGTASAATPSQNGHLTTKLYVDNADSTLTTNLANSGTNLSLIHI